MLEKWIRIRKEGEDRYIVVNLRGGAFVVNELGKIILEEYIKGESINAIAKILSDKYNISLQNSKKLLKTLFLDFMKVVL